MKLLPSASPLWFPPDDIVYGQSLSRGFTVTLSSFLRTVFHCPRLILCMVGNPLTASTGRSQSRAIGEVVAPVALLSGITLSPQSPVRYGRHRWKIVISLRSPSLLLLGLGRPLLLLPLRFRWLVSYCLPSLAGSLLPLPPGLCSLMMVSGWDLAWLSACWWTSLAPSDGLHAPWTSTPLCVLLRPWLYPASSLIPLLIRQNRVYCWAKGGLSTVLGFWCSFLNGLEVSFLFLGCSLSGWGFFLWAACLRRVFGSMISGLYFHL